MPPQPLLSFYSVKAGASSINRSPQPMQLFFSFMPVQVKRIVSGFLKKSRLFSYSLSGSAFANPIFIVYSFPTFLKGRIILRIKTNTHAQVIQLLFFTSIFLFAFSTPQARKSKDGSSSWYGEAIDVIKTRYSEEFIDSLRNRYRVDHSNSLRKNGPHQFTEYSEHLVYSVQWGFVKAGWGILSTRPRSDKTLELSAMAISNNFVSAIYPVRDYIRCIVDEEGFYPLFFEEHINEGRYSANRWELYDHKKGKVHASKKKNRSDSMDLFIQTYLSAFYYFRAQKWDVGDTIHIKTFASGKSYPLDFVCVGKENFEIDGKNYVTLEVVPFLKKKAMIFGRGDKISVLMTDDESRIPLYVKAQIKLGHVAATLVHSERHKVTDRNSVPALPQKTNVTRLKR